MACLALRGASPDPKAARAHLEKAVELDATFTPARLMLAAALLEAGGTERAQALVGKLGKVDRLGRDAVALHNRVRMRLAWAQGDVAKAWRTYMTTGGMSQPESFQKEMSFRALAALQKGDVPKEAAGGLSTLAGNAARYAKTEGEKVAVQALLARLHARGGGHAATAAALEKAGVESAEQQLLLADTCALAMLAAKTDKERAVYRKKALDFYGRVLGDDAIVAARGSALVRHVIGFCDAVGDVEAGTRFFREALRRFPDDPALLRREAHRCFMEGDLRKGREHLVAALKKDPKQSGLAKEMERLNAAPVFQAARAVTRPRFTSQPLLYVRVASGSPFPIAAGRTVMKLDGTAVTPLRGGAECFYMPPKALSDGKHTVTVRAHDGAGNTATTSFDFTVDGSPPTVVLVAPAGPAREAQPVLDIQSSDASGVVPQSVYVYVKNGPGTQFYGKTLIAGGVYGMTDTKLRYAKGQRLADPARVRVRVPDRLAPGRYLVDVRVADPLGQQTKTTFELRVLGP
jgi:hypothetical protein